jgi:hypothetical protein
MNDKPPEKKTVYAYNSVLGRGITWLDNLSLTMIGYVANNLRLES